MTASDSDRRPVVVFGANRYVLDRADRNRLYVILVETPDLVAESSIAAADETILTDYTDPQAALARLLQSEAVRQARHVFSARETALQTAAALGAALGLPVTPGDVVDLIADKAAFRRRLFEAGLSPFAGLRADTIQDFAAAVRDVGGPAFAKPVDSMGSDGVGRIDAPDQIAAAWHRGGGRPMIVEPYLDGPEVSVEAFSFAGRHKIMTITDKALGPNFVERGHSAPAALDPAMAERIARATDAILTEIGLRDGASHTEFKLTAAGPVVIETHNRTGGDMISYLTELANGTNPFWLAFRWQTGLLPLPEALALPDWRGRSGAAAVRFFWPAPGVVRAVRNVEAARALPGVRMLTLGLAPGDVVKPVLKSADRVGLVIAEAAAPEAAIAICEQVLDLVEIETETQAETPSLTDDTGAAPRLAARQTS